MLETYIIRELKNTFQNAELEVLNESHQHNVAPGSETHFKVTLVSESFDAQSRVSRHRQVNKALKGAFEQGLHALSLKLYTPQEWAVLDAVPLSPPCLGGSQAGGA